MGTKRGPMNQATIALVVAVLSLLLSIGQLSFGTGRTATSPPMHIQHDPAASELVDGYSPGLKVSINNHGDSAQPGAGDSTGVVSYGDDMNGRQRIWATVSGLSSYYDETMVVAG